MSRFAILPALVAAIILSVLPGSAQGLKLSVSVQNQTIVAPNPVRVLLRFQNSGQHTIWLYRPIGSASQIPSANPFEFAASEPGPNQTAGGSDLRVHLAPINAQANDNEGLAAHGAAMLTGNFPHPELIGLMPGKEYDEQAAIHVEPARAKTGNGQQFVWGRYRFSLTYSAHYSNEKEIEHDLGADLWHEQLRSNEITLDLQPPAAQGSIEGTVVDSGGRPLGDILATLSDKDENVLDQLRTDAQGSFSFTHLASGRYWVAVRELGATEDTTVYRHFDLRGSAGHASAQLMMLPVETNDPKQQLHKPVLFRIVDNSGHALAGVTLSILWAPGTAVENTKAVTNEEGFATANLLPGRNFVTISRHGCSSEERRADVEPGLGVNGFEFAYNCPQK